MILVDDVSKCLNDVLRHPIMRKNYMSERDFVELRRIVAALVREAYWEGYQSRNQNLHETIILCSINGRKASKWEVKNEKMAIKRFRQMNLNNKVYSFSLEELEDISFKAESQLFFKKIEQKGGEEVWDAQRI